jgi:hypothetical protein
MACTASRSSYTYGPKAIGGPVGAGTALCYAARALGPLFAPAGGAGRLVAL